MQIRTTRDRILGEATRLFAQRGFRGTTISDISQAAGLSPGAGGLYKHFSSKEAVLRAVVGEALDRVEAVSSSRKYLTGDDPARELTLLARACVVELRDQSEVVRLLYRDLDQFPDLLTEARSKLVDAVYRDLADWLRGYAKRGLFEAGNDYDAVAAVAISALVSYVVVESFVGEPPAGVDEDRFVTTWVDMLLRHSVAGLVQDPDSWEETQ